MWSGLVQNCSWDDQKLLDILKNRCSSGFDICVLICKKENIHDFLYVLQFPKCFGVWPLGLVASTYFALNLVLSFQKHRSERWGKAKFMGVKHLRVGSETRHHVGNMTILLLGWGPLVGNAARHVFLWISFCFNFTVEQKALRSERGLGVGGWGWGLLQGDLWSVQKELMLVRWCMYL